MRINKNYDIAKLAEEFSKVSRRIKRGNKRFKEKIQLCCEVGYFNSKQYYGCFKKVKSIEV